MCLPREVASGRRSSLRTGWRLLRLSTTIGQAGRGATLQDTATAAQTLYDAGGGWDNWRRNVDYYDEGELVWLDVDTTIRKMTNGKKSINDFVAKFHGLGGDTAPKVVPYTFDDVVAGLNGVVANDWGTTFSPGTA